MNFAACILAVSLLVGCRKDNSSDSGIQGVVVSQKYKWPHHTVAICYDEDKSEMKFADQMPLIKKIAEDEYNAKTVFKFTGFHMCSQEPSALIRIVFNKIGRSVTTLNSAASSESPDQKFFRCFAPSFATKTDLELFSVQYKEYLTDPSLKNAAEIILYNTILHELGHAVGLDHEEMRNDNKSKIFCDSKDLEQSQRIPGSVDVGSFDVYSIMNYCVKGLESRKLTLSQGDIAAVNHLYADDTSQITQKSGDPLGDAKKEFGCFGTATKSPNYDGCAQVLKKRAALRGAQIGNVTGSHLSKLAFGCFLKYSQMLTCDGRVLSYLFDTWPADNFNCIANGGGWGCIEPAPVAAAPAQVPSYEQAVQNRIDTSSSDAKNHTGEFKTTGSVRCFRDSITSCLQGKGGGGCVIRDCIGTGDLLCQDAQKLYGCAVANGGTGCFDSSHADCAISNGGGSR